MEAKCGMMIRRLRIKFGRYQLSYMLVQQGTISYLTTLRIDEAPITLYELDLSQIVGTFRALSWSLVTLCHLGLML